MLQSDIIGRVLFGFLLHPAVLIPKIHPSIRKSGQLGVLGVVLQDLRLHVGVGDSAEGDLAVVLKSD